MSAIQSPCRNVCEVDPAGRFCIGCGRTLAEIEAWTRLTPQQREAIMQQLPTRLAKGVRA